MCVNVFQMHYSINSLYKMFLIEYEILCTNSNYPINDIVKAQWQIFLPTDVCIKF
jgi:hypothetical protein